MLSGLSFLGTGDYKLVKYKYQDQIVQTSLFPFAFCKFFGLGKLFLVVTSEAKAKHLINLYSTFEENQLSCEIQEIFVPPGKDENELWEIFEIITNNLPNDVELVFDITHSFRSMPFILIAICNYLATIKNIKIINVVYGAFEASSDDVKPVFELYPFLELMKWSIATNQFIKFGSASELRNLLRLIHSETFTKLLPTRSKVLSQVGDALDRLTTALHIARIKEAVVQSGKFAEYLSILTQDLENISRSKPFKMLLNKILQRFLPLKQASASLFNPDGFKAQLKMLRFYLETENYMQAISLAREILVSFVATQNNLEPLVRKNRLMIEEQLGILLDKLQKNETLDKDSKLLAQLWGNIASVRNDIDHCGMNENPTNSSKAIENIKKFCEDTEKFLLSKLD